MPWLTNEIKNTSYHRDYLKRKATFGFTVYNEEYKKCKNCLNKLIKITKAEYFKTKLENTSNSRNGRQVVNELLKSSN